MAEGAIPGQRDERQLTAGHPQFNCGPTTFARDESGLGYYRREDGSIRARMLYVNGLAHGTAVYFDADGSVIREVMFREGVQVSNDAP